MSGRLACASGVDPGGGAGLALDLRVAARLGVVTAAVPTCLTVQTRAGFVRAEPVEPGLLRAMLDAARADGDGALGAVKVGMCADAASVRVVAEWFAALCEPRPWLVVDPVLGATAGGAPARAKDVAAELLGRLLPLGAVVTPNLDELVALTGTRDAESGAAILLERGSSAVLVKGGHGEGQVVVDRLVTRDGERVFHHARVSRGPVHGTGCALASGIAARLAQGDELFASTAAAITDVVRWIAHTRDSRDGLPDAIEVG
ncbi:MAG: hydroxymethylpyrimidine/phosphomethylpyrimidine kinase [Planctomycetes bacterium]|nr:hydroxymethylpyrimidine/phosphomethylpyrimidine kinase [Planctomycetota bacterium]